MPKTGHHPSIDTQEYLEQNLISLFEKTFKRDFSAPAFSDFATEVSFTYGQTAYHIAVLDQLYHTLDIKEGAKVALYAKDSARWCVAFIATLATGRVVVPILSDFNIEDASKLIAHSESNILFVGDKNAYDTLPHNDLPNLKCVISLADFSILWIADGFEDAAQKYAQAIADKDAMKAYTPEEIHFNCRDNSELMLINYTSGTTGYSKGVMLSGHNLAGNALYAHRLDLMYRGDQILCFLPLAHAYSCAFNLLTPMTLGAHVVILGKVPSPQILAKAFQTVRPNLIITVPLVLEKIYNLAILPKLQKPAFKFALAIPGIRDIIYSNVLRSMKKFMGNNFREVIAGGAAMREDVALFFKKVKFPLTVGYGMTECGPLISYESHKHWIPGSSGKCLQNMQLKIVDVKGDDGVSVHEVWVKGQNVCAGYYKNEQATRDLFCEEGWMRTGDLGNTDKDGNLFLQGRLKTMLLTSSGQNIYPEEIESRIVSHPLVSEAIVILNDKKNLEALIYIDPMIVKNQGLSMQEAEEKVSAYRKELNKKVANYEKIAWFTFREEPFEKTPKHSIKRFLYSHSQ